MRLNLSFRLYYVVVLIALLLSGCTAVQTKASALWETLTSTSNEKKTENRDEAIKKTGYAGKKDMLTISAPTIKPPVLTKGEKLSYQLTYTLLSLDAKKEFDVFDVITISGQDLLLELSRKTSKKSQGSHISDLEFTLPPDLRPGVYKLISNIKAGGLEGRQQGTFTVTR